MKIIIEEGKKRQRKSERESIYYIIYKIACKSCKRITQPIYEIGIVSLCVCCVYFFMHHSFMFLGLRLFNAVLSLRLQYVILIGRS